MSKTFSLVVPVYNNRETLGALVNEVGTLASRLDGKLEVIFVIDGSPDDSVTVLRSALPAPEFDARIVELSRNFGSFSAIRVGLAESNGDCIAVMAADLQEPIELVEEFFAEMAAGHADVVVGKRATRDDPLASTLSARAYWGLYRRIVNPAIPEGGVDIFGCTREVANVLATMTEVNTSLVGLLFWSGFTRIEVEYARRPRMAGKSGWSFRRKLRYLTDSVFAFTDLPLIALQVIGAAGIMLSLVAGIAVFVAWLTGLVAEPGYTPLMLTITGSTSIILLGIGILGSYVWRAYENSKGRPYALVMRRELLERLEDAK